jgi:hypothetical protein
MTGKSIVVLMMIILCIALSNVWASSVFKDGRVHNIDFAATTDVNSNTFSEIIIVNLLVGGIAITFCGWLLRKRRTS